MPLSSGSFSSSSVRPARPPPNSVLKVCWKFWLIAAKASRKRALRRLVDALDRFAGLRDRVDEVLALRRQERVARFELVELLDRHHVHGTEAIDLGFQRRNGVFGREAGRRNELRGRELCHRRPPQRRLTSRPRTPLRRLPPRQRRRWPVRPERPLPRVRAVPPPRVRHQASRPRFRDTAWTGVRDRFPRSRAPLPALLRRTGPRRATLEPIGSRRRGFRPRRFAR